MSFKSIRESLIRFSGGEGKVPVLFFLGIAGMLLILFSSFLDSPAPKNRASTAEELTVQQYTDQLEQRMYEIVKSIDGVGRAKVMITLESSPEYVYALEEKSTSDTLRDFDAEQVGKLQEKSSSENGYIMVEGKDGRKQALVQKLLEPKVKGAIVVCQGADNPQVRQRVTEAVTTALGIPSTRVCVTKISQ